MGQPDNKSRDATSALGSDAVAATGTMARGRRIGHYELRELLGAGGMGQVYLAMQLEPVQREVALKLLPAQLASPMARALFEVERQALARMQHPAVARIFDAGTTDDGQAWIAMELVEGVPLHRYCAEHQLGLADRLRLFQRVCHGVQHAHQKGVIHRDLKPDNVLVREVDGSAWPTLIDFGIAIGRDSHGSERERAGTVAYMSPEQLAGKLADIDTRSDVYSLGVMLFEVLVGGSAVQLTTRLFQSAVERDGVDGAFEPGGTSDGRVRALLLDASRALPRELRAVLHKALAPAREDRYDSAAALGQDLDRYLRHAPLQAMAPTHGYRLRKFAVRHRLAITASLLIFAALVAGIVVALEGRHRARLAAAEAQVQAARAERVSGFVSDILAGVDPDVAKGKDTTLMHTVLDTAAARAGNELAGEPEVRASIEHTIASAYSALGLYTQAVEHNKDALAAAREAGLPALRQARILMGMAVNEVNAGVPAKQYLAHAETAQELIRGAPADDPARLSVEHDIALLDFRAGRLENALALMEEVVPRMRKVLPPGAPDLGLGVSLLATIHSEMGAYAKAEPLFREVLERAVKQHGEAHSSTLNAANELAINLMREKRFAAAERLLRHYLPVATRLYGADHPFRMGMYSNLGGAIRQQGRNEEARPYYRHALQWALDTYGPDSYQAVLAEANLAFLLRDTGALGAAERHARLAVTHVDRALGGDNGARGQMLDLLGTILVRKHEYAQAAQALDRAWQIYTTASGYGPDHPLAQETARHQIELYEAWDKPDEVKLWKERLGAGATR